MPSVSLLSGDYSNHRFSRHHHDEWEIGVSAAGSALVWIGGKNHRLDPGSVLLASSRQAHGAKGQGDEPWSYRALLVPPATLRAVGAAAGLGGSALRFRAPVVRDPELASELLDLHRHLFAPRPVESARPRLETLLATSLRRYAEEAAPAEAALRNPAIRRVRDHLEAHFAENISLEELSDLAQLSRFHLLRIFSKATGLPPNAYQQACRIRAAQRMLRAGRPIAHVALDVGYASVSHFTRQFKKIIGAPPGVWTRGVRKSS